MENNHSVNTVKKFRTEPFFQFSEQFLFHLLVFHFTLFAFIRLRRQNPMAEPFLIKSAPILLVMIIIALRKLTRRALGIGQMSIIEDLQQNIKNILMRFFNFIE